MRNEKKIVKKKRIGQALQGLLCLSLILSSSFGMQPVLAQESETFQTEREKTEDSETGEIEETENLTDTEDAGKPEEPEESEELENPEEPQEIDKTGWHPGLSGKAQGVLADAGSFALPEDAQIITLKADSSLEEGENSLIDQAQEILGAGKEVMLVHESGLDSPCDEARTFVQSISALLPDVVLALSIQPETLKQEGSVWAKDFADWTHYFSGVRPIVYVSDNNDKDWYDWSILDLETVWFASQSSQDGLFSGTLKSFVFNGGDNSWQSLRQADEAHSWTQPVYRLYNPSTREHLYTSIWQERTWLSQHGWKEEGVCWTARYLEETTEPAPEETPEGGSGENTDELPEDSFQNPEEETDDDLVKEGEETEDFSDPDDSETTDSSQGADQPEEGENEDGKNDPDEEADQDDEKDSDDETDSEDETDPDAVDEPQTLSDFVMRLFNQGLSDHLYTIDKNEIEFVTTRGWVLEPDSGWYLEEEAQTPVYRLYQPSLKTGSHHFTTDENEYKYLVSVGWKDEGIAWKAQPGFSSRADYPYEKTMDGQTYYFTETGIKQTGLIVINKKTYYFHPEKLGAKQMDCIVSLPDGRTVGFLSDGTLASGLSVIAGKTYMFAENYSMLKGTVATKGAIKLFDEKTGVYIRDLMAVDTSLMTNHNTYVKDFAKVNTDNNVYPWLEKDSDEIKYIVIHYTAGSTSRSGSALNTLRFFEAQDYSSATFAVDDTTIAQYADYEAGYRSWHCGDTFYGGPYGGTEYKKCRNINSVGIEICSNNVTGGYVSIPNSSTYWFSNAAVDNAVLLTRALLGRYPGAKVIRHYDVSGKVCPGVPGWNDYLGASDAKWQEFLTRVYS